MNSEDLERIESICHAALARGTEERAAYLDEACQGDFLLRNEVDSLIAHSDEAEEFLTAPATEIAAAMLALEMAAESDPNPALPDDPMLGRVISHYRLLKRLGQGGMGVVYKAKDLKLGRLLAIKFLPEAGRGHSSPTDREGYDSQILARFEHEARACSALDHPNICTIYEVNQFEGMPFIAMQLLHGETLEQMIAGRPLATGKIIGYGAQIADALHAAHTAGILHRDIKPANIFITQRGEVKVLDFGLAKHFAHREDLAEIHKAPGARKLNLPFQRKNTFTEPGMAFGTASYMSPEQVLSEELDSRSDIFSLGALLYEMATGKQAFPGETPTQVFDALLYRTPSAPSESNSELPAALEQIIFKALEKNREQRYQTAAELRDDLQHLQKKEELQPFTGSRPAGGFTPFLARFRRKKIVALVIASGTAIAAGAAFFYLHAWRPPPLGKEDTILLADFANSTGDAAFDETLKQALRVQLEQSPFLSVVSEGKAKDTLGYMGRSSSDAIVGEMAREVCLRTDSKIMLAGSIAKLGSHYVLGISAINCQTGETSDTEQLEVENREEVLRALSKLSTKLRRRLGESLISIGKFDVPLEQVTTSSLDALRAYSLGIRTSLIEGDAAAAPFFQHATEIDPNFAMAYAELGRSLYNRDEVSGAIQPADKAFHLRSQVSEHERLYIQSVYYTTTGQYDKAIQVLEMWHTIYPRDLTPLIDMADACALVGRHERGLTTASEAVRLGPNNSIAWNVLANAHANLNQLQQARETLEEAQKRNVQGLLPEPMYYQLAFVRGDTAEMDHQLKMGMNHSGYEDWFLATQADTEAYSGHLDKAREFTRRAINSALSHNKNETAAGYQAIGALREAAFGNRQLAQNEANAALASGSGILVRTLAALALAQAGAPDRARNLADELQRQRPLDILLKEYWLTTVYASNEIEDRNPAKALDLLEPSLEYELGVPKNPTNAYPYPLYVRGYAFLASARGNEAAAEFRKIIDHPGIVGNYPLGALAHLGLARSYAIEAGVPYFLLHQKTHWRSGSGIESTQPKQILLAKAEYEVFLTMWKNADPDIPILKEAQEEYRSLQLAPEHR